MEELPSNITIPFSAACERNKDAILEVISPYLSEGMQVLEIGSGTAQHAVHFVSQLDGLVWQPSDCKENLPGIVAQIENARRHLGPLKSLRPPIELDVNQSDWRIGGVRYPVVYSANTFHIMDWHSVEAFFDGLVGVTQVNSYLIIYGPFRYQGIYTSESNKLFDMALQSRGVGSAIRDTDDVEELAKCAGFELTDDVNMPANNQCLIFKRNK